MKRTSQYLSNKPYLKLFILFAIDLFSLVLAWYSTLFLSQETPENSSWLPICFLFSAQIGAYFYFKIHQIVWRFISLHAFSKIIKATSAAFLFLAFISLIFKNLSTPIPFLILDTFLLTALWTSGRLFYRYSHERNPSEKNAVRLLLIGGGQAAELFLRNIQRLPTKEYIPVGILDDNSSLKNREIHGVKILGKINDLSKITAQHKVDLITLAIPSLKQDRLKEILELTKFTNIPLRSVPSLAQLVSGEISINQLKEISLEDLLLRDPVRIDKELLRNTYSGKNILVTGGGGSIGSELCRQILALAPKKLLIADHAEFNLYQIEQEFSQYPQLAKTLTYHLVNITDKTAMEAIFQAHSIDIVLHAAAYKHVPLLETQARQALQNNLLGTRNLALLAAQYQIKKFIMISTDKAVNPTNIMGASKRAAEVFCQNLNQTVQTEFITVRFGNVLGSAGSVVPLFQKQLLTGGPLTVTHPDMTRFFMTIHEACCLVLTAGAYGSGGEIFVLDMGDPIKIKDLAENMIRLSGKTPGSDIEIIYTGLRPGEKLYEELFHAQEKLSSTDLEKILVSSARGVDFSILKTCLEQLEQAISKNETAWIKEILRTMVPEYAPSPSVAVEADLVGADL